MIRQVGTDFRTENPQYTSYYHENLAKEVVEETLAKWPYVIGFPSYAAGRL